MQVEIEAEVEIIHAMADRVTELNQMNGYHFTIFMKRGELRRQRILIVQASDPMHFYTLGIEHAKILFKIADTVKKSQLPSCGHKRP